MQAREGAHMHCPFPGDLAEVRQVLVLWAVWQFFLWQCRRMVNSSGGGRREREADEVSLLSDSQCWCVKYRCGNSSTLVSREEVVADAHL